MNSHSSAQRRSLVDFLNHGRLPFAGRAGEVARVVEFWKGTVDASSLRTMLLLGEGGVGKSRVVEEALKRITDAGGMVLQTKLYRDTAVSLLSLIVRELAASGLTGMEEEVSAIGIDLVARPLRRIARLHPTVLVIEDIHLLEGDGLCEFAGLLSLLADETLSLVVTSRPADPALRGTLEPSLVEELRLEGLGQEDIETIWGEIFGGTIDHHAVTSLYEVTCGNALALRSALRGALSSGAVGYDEESGIWKVMVTRGSLLEQLRQSVRLLVTGMLGHLTAEELHAVGRLSWLGEIFSREGADILLQDADRIISQLLFKGALDSSPPSATPLSDSGSNQLLLAFSHSLLHRELVDSHRADPKLLLEIIRDRIPLYSILPFQLLRDEEIDSGTDTETIRCVAEQAITISGRLDRSTNWKLADHTIPLVDLLFDRFPNAWDDHERAILRARRLEMEISLLRRTPAAERYRVAVEELDELTRDPETGQMREHRLVTLAYRHHRDWKAGGTQLHTIREEAYRLLERFPELLLTRGYVIFLQSASLAALALGERKLLVEIKDRLHAILKSPGTDEEFRELARRGLMPHLLTCFETAEELDEHLEFARGPGSGSGPAVERQFNLIHLLMHIGRYGEALDEITLAIPRLKQFALHGSLCNTHLFRIQALAAIGASRSRIEGEIEALIAETPEELLPALGEHIAEYFIPAALLMGDGEWARLIARRHTPLPGELSPLDAAMLSLQEGELKEGAEALLQSDDEHHILLREFATLAVDDGNITPQLLNGARASLVEPLLTVEQIYQRLLLLELIDAIAKEGSTEAAKALRETTHTGISTLLGWLHERSAIGFMKPIVERHGKQRDRGEQMRWNESLRQIEAERSPLPELLEDGRIRITMLGDITIARGSGSPVRIRGSRVRALLGVMVADQMLDKSLRSGEFAQIAIGEEDPERARRALPVAVYRLREAIGQTSVLTDGENPRLNLDLLSVDLLQAQKLLRESDEALRDRSLLRARPALIKALGIAGGEVPFPSLYDEFFEAARGDFEFRLRRSAMGVVRALLHEEEPASAKEILQRMAVAMPGDEEITTVLAATLAQLGERTEAERMRIRLPAEE